MSVTRYNSLSDMQCACVNVSSVYFVSKSIKFVLYNIMLPFLCNSFDHCFQKQFLLCRQPLDILQIILTFNTILPHYSKHVSSCCNVAVVIIVFVVVVVVIPQSYYIYYHYYRKDRLHCY